MCMYLELLVYAAKNYIDAGFDGVLLLQSKNRRAAQVLLCKNSERCLLDGMTPIGL